MDVAEHHRVMSIKHQKQMADHADMALLLQSCTGKSCSTSMAASTAAARKSAKSAEVSSSHATTELKFLNLATHHENQAAANPKHQKEADKSRKSAVHYKLYNSLWGKRFTQHKLGKRYAKAGIPLGVD